MAEQYFEREPSCPSRPVRLDFAYRGQTLGFETDAGVFSRGEMDRGTALLLDALPPLTGDVLDLGCGWGAIGICLAKACPQARLTLADVNLRALALARANARRNGVTAEVVESDGFAALGSRTFQAVVTNPPIRAGKAAIYAMFRDSAAHLAPGGSLYLVIRKQQGGPSCVEFLKTLFPLVQALDKSGGYWVLEGKKQEA